MQWPDHRCLLCICVCKYTLTYICRCICACVFSPPPPPPWKTKDSILRAWCSTLPLVSVSHTLILLFPYQLINVFSSFWWSRWCCWWWWWWSLTIFVCVLGTVPSTSQVLTLQGSQRPHDVGTESWDPPPQVTAGIYSPSEAKKDFPPGSFWSLCGVAFHIYISFPCGVLPARSMS